MSKIELNEVSVSYKLPKERRHHITAEVKAIDRVSLMFADGDRVGVIGRNGGGKSTLLSIMAGNIVPQSGKIALEGERLSLINRNSGLIPQATLRENATIKAYSFGLKGERLEAYVSNVFEYSNLTDRASSPLNSLSTGMAGRFNIALNSQVIKPITILDEWVGTLDVSGEGGGHGLLNRLATEAKIVVVASHNDKLIRQLCNRVVLLEQGTVLYDGINFDRAFKMLSAVKRMNLNNYYSGPRLKSFFYNYRHNDTLKKYRRRLRKKKYARLIAGLKLGLEQKIVNASFKNQSPEFINESLSPVEEPSVDSCDKNSTSSQFTELEKSTANESDVELPKLHFLHIGKTAGYIPRKIFAKASSNKYKLVFHSINTKLADIPEGDKVVVFVRHPIERFSRAFFSRKNSGAPFYISSQNDIEREAFSQFRTPNLLAEALSGGIEHSSDAFKAVFGIQFMAQPLSEQLGNKAYWLERERDVLFLGDSKVIIKELEIISNLIGVDGDASRELSEFEIGHFSSELSGALSDKAKNNLNAFYKSDIKFYEFLKARIKPIRNTNPEIIVNYDQH